MSSLPARLGAGAATLLTVAFAPMALIVLAFTLSQQDCSASPVAPTTSAGPAVPTSGSGPPAHPGQFHYTQAQMQTAVAQYDPAQAVALGAIAMAESGGWNWPDVNSTGTYHGPWQFQEASNPSLNFWLLDTNLNYAAKAAGDLARTGITHQKWETWPTMAAKYMGGATTAQTTQVAAVTPASPVQGPGGVVAGPWAPGVDPIVRMIAARFHVAAGTYPDHHPDEGHAADFGYLQFGVDAADGAPGQSGVGAQWQIAQWIASNVVDRGFAWYVIHHESYHGHGDPPGVWRPMGLSTDPTAAHFNHVHVSWAPWYGNAGGSPTSAFPPAHNFSSPPRWTVPPLPKDWASLPTIAPNSTGCTTQTATMRGLGLVGGTAKTQEVVAYAEHWIGYPYRPPYYDPSGFSCDGLVWWVFSHFGITLPKGATNQMNAVQRIAPDQVRPGDLVGFHQDGPSSGNPLGLEFHHIGIVVSPGVMVNALGTNEGVLLSQIANIDTGPGHYVRYGRILK